MSTEEKKPDERPLRCPRCKAPKLHMHAQEKPALPYARCVACGWAGGIWNVLPPEQKPEKH